MALNRFMVDDIGKFGKLVKKWAKNTVPLPRNKEEFEAQLTKNGIVASWPTGSHKIVSVIVEKVPLGVLHLMVAPKELIEESEALYKKKSTVYPLPEYYQLDAFHVKPSIADNLDFNDKRTGDYTISHCS